MPTPLPGVHSRSLEAEALEFWGRVHDIGTQSAACGGHDGDASGWGEIFELSPPAKAGGAWTESASEAPFAGVFAHPSGGAVLGSGGAVHSFTGSGGGGTCINNGCGVLLKITPPASAGGTWSWVAEHKFTGGTDGATPEVSLTEDASGNLHGTTANGGAAGDCTYGFSVYGWGTALELKP